MPERRRPTHLATRHVDRQAVRACSPGFSRLLLTAAPPSNVEGRLSVTHVVVNGEHRRRCRPSPSRCHGLNHNPRWDGLRDRHPAARSRASLLAVSTPRAPLTTATAGSMWGVTVLVKAELRFAGAFSAWRAHRACGDPGCPRSGKLAVQASSPVPRRQIPFPFRHLEGEAG